MRLIDADALLKDINDYPYGYRGMIKDTIARQPTVVPKHGHWIDDWDIGCSVCSECGDSFLWEDFNGVGEFNYCPTCGAKMTGESDE